MDPESTQKKFRYLSKNKLDNYDITHSTIFQPYLEFLSADQVKELNWRIRICSMLRPQQTEEVLANEHNQVINEVCYHQSKKTRDAFFNDPYYSLLFLLFIEHGHDFIQKREHGVQNKQTFRQIIQEFSQQARSSLQT